MRFDDIEITIEALSKCLNIIEISFNYMSINISNNFIQNLSNLKKLKLLDLKYSSILEKNKYCKVQKLKDTLSNCEVLYNIYFFN